MFALRLFRRTDLAWWWEHCQCPFQKIVTQGCTAKQSAANEYRIAWAFTAPLLGFALEHTALSITAKQPAVHEQAVPKTNRPCASTEFRLRCLSLLVVSGFPHCFRSALQVEVGLQQLHRVHLADGLPDHF